MIPILSSNTHLPPNLFLWEEEKMKEEEKKTYLKKQFSNSSNFTLQDKQRVV